MNAVRPADGEAAGAHPLDVALTLQHLGGDQFRGCCGRSYWNVIGPFGGYSAALMLKAVMQHPDRLGDPVSLTVHYPGALVEGDFDITARAARTNRSTQHWQLELSQVDGQGQRQTVLLATAMTAQRRSTWGASDVPPPRVPPPEGLPPARRPASLAWFRNYDLRQIQGGIPHEAEIAEPAGDAADRSLSLMWMRDEPPRALDHCALAALADVFFPRIFLRRPRRVPAGTVSMTVYFHADAAGLNAHGGGFVLGQARGQVYADGYFDQIGHLWSRSGEPLVTTTQLVYFKE